MEGGDQAGSGPSSVGDDELVDAPVLVAAIGQVAADDDGDLASPAAGERHRCTGLARQQEGHGPGLAPAPSSPSSCQVGERLGTRLTPRHGH